MDYEDAELLIEIESMRQQLAAAHQTSDLNAEALEEAQADLVNLRQQLAECERERDALQSERTRIQLNAIEWADKIAALQAKYDAVVAALEKIQGTNASKHGTMGMMLNRCTSIATAALAKVGADKTGEV